MLRVSCVQLCFLIPAHFLYSSWNVGNSRARIMYDTCLCNKFHFSTSKTTTICLRAKPSFKNSLFQSFLSRQAKIFSVFFAATRILMRSASFYFHSKLASRLNLLLTEAFSEDPDLSEVPLCRIKAGMNHRLIESFWNVRVLKLLIRSKGSMCVYKVNKLK